MNANPLPGQNEHAVENRLGTRIFRYVGLLVGTVSLGVLYLMAIHRDIPVFRIGDVKPMMNYAYVRVAGTVSGETRTFKEGEHVRSIRFAVDDGTGELSVTAYRSQAQALVDQDRVPRAGDRVEVAGSLIVAADDEIQMRLQVPEQMVLTRGDVPATPLAGITGAMEGKTVLVEGSIQRVVAPRPESRMPWTLVVDDGSGRQELTFWHDIYADIPDKILLAPGTLIRARATVRTYRDKVQLSLGSGLDLEFPATASPANLVAGPGAPKNDVQRLGPGDVTAAMEGQAVQVSGRIAALKEPGVGSKAPYEITLQDGEKTLAIIYWSSVADRLTDNNKPVVGALLTAKGMVGSYKGKLQLKVTRADELTVESVTPSAAPAAAPAPSTVGAITTASVGKTCTLKGTLGESMSIKGGVIYPLNDGTGEIQLLLWDKSVSGPERDALSAGRKVVVTGLVKEYKGKLELVPARGQDIRVEPVAP